MPGWLLPLFTSGIGWLVDWLHKKKLISSARAQNFYAWVASTGERKSWSVDRMQKIAELRLRLADRLKEREQKSL